MTPAKNSQQIEMAASRRYQMSRSHVNPVQVKAMSSATLGGADPQAPGSGR